MRCLFAARTRSAWRSCATAIVRSELCIAPQLGRLPRVAVARQRESSGVVPLLSVRGGYPYRAEHPGLAGSARVSRSGSVAASEEAAGRVAAASVARSAWARDG